MAIGTPSSVNNIFSQENGKLSAARSVGGNMRESDFRDLSRKEAAIDVGIRKDELEYEITKDMSDQDKKLEDEEFDRVFGGLFK